MAKNEDSTPLFGKKVSFAEAYPQIEDITVEVQESGKGADSSNRNRRYTKDHFPGDFIACSNPVCSRQGFFLGFYLHGMVSEGKTELEKTDLCKGSESPRRSCPNTFKFKIAIKYKHADSK
jgi:hypothetical protein